MRVAIDARELVGKPTGVGRYLAGLLREWASGRSSHGHEMLVYAHRPIESVPGLPQTLVLPGSGGTLWEQRDLARAIERDKVDVLFSPAYSTPLFTRTPRVVALHDISFAARPEWFSWREGLRRRVLAKRAAAAARTVVTISEFSKAEIATRFGVASSKIHVIPPGIDAPIATRSDEGRPSDANVLFVGSIFNRRHVPELIDAFSQLASRHPEVRLHLVGDNRSHPYLDVAALIAASPGHARIEWHRYASDTQLQELYRGARAFAFLSEYEGLGLTPLEALSAGVPSLLLDTPVARESCGRAALYVDVPAANRIATDLERLLYDDGLRRDLLAQADAALARYDWKVAARETMKVLEDAR
jgi:glycosyltransferase involved in cell wall biosynthesis